MELAGYLRWWSGDRIQLWLMRHLGESGSTGGGRVNAPPAGPRSPGERAGPAKLCKERLAKLPQKMPRSSNLNPRSLNLDPRSLNLDPRTSILDPRSSNLSVLHTALSGSWLIKYTFTGGFVYLSRRRIHISDTSDRIRV